MSSKIDIDDINTTWNDVNENYNEFHDRVSFLFKINELNKNTNTHIVIRDKIHLLLSDMKDIVSLMERICNQMDCDNVNKGMIQVNNSSFIIKNC